MGTRSLTRIYEDGQLLVQLYKQYDGYPSGWGLQLARYLSGGTAHNGIVTDAKLHQYWNGAGDLAAQLIAHFKTRVGSLYIESPKAVDCGQEYEYEIHVNGPVILLDIYESHSSGLVLRYHGTPKDLLPELVPVNDVS